MTQELKGLKQIERIVAGFNEMGGSLSYSIVPAAKVSGHYGWDSGVNILCDDGDRNTVLFNIQEGAEGITLRDDPRRQGGIESSSSDVMDRIAENALSCCFGLKDLEAQRTQQIAALKQSLNL